MLTTHNIIVDNLTFLF